MSAVGLSQRYAPAVWRRRFRWGLIYAGLLLVTVVMLYPFWFMGATSLHSLPQYYAGRGYSFTSWRDLFHALPVLRELFNSLLIVTGSLVLLLAAATTAGYAFGTLRYRFSGVAFLIIASAMMIPIQSMIIPEYVNLARIGFINHYYAAILVYAAIGTPFATFLLTMYFRRLPEDVIEASLMDGLGYTKIFFRIMLPLAVPAIVTVAVLQFIQIWDDLLVGLLLLQSPHQRPITVGLATLPSAHAFDLPELMAGSLISALPAIVAYLLFQRYLIRGLTMGMSK